MNYDVQHIVELTEPPNKRSLELLAMIAFSDLVLRLPIELGQPEAFYVGYH